MSSIRYFRLGRDIYDFSVSSAAQGNVVQTQNNAKFATEDRMVHLHSSAEAVGHEYRVAMIMR